MTATPHATDRAALVTGATAGAGYRTAQALAARGLTVLISGDDRTRGAAAAARLRRRAGHDRVYFLRADHSTVAGNLALAAAVAERVDRLGVLVNNAGGAYPQRRETADGYESTLATNVIGPFTLTRALLPLVRRPGARCVNVVSPGGAGFTGDPFSDVHSVRHYTAAAASARAGLLALAWTLELARRERAWGPRVFAADPGAGRSAPPPRPRPGRLPAPRPLRRIARTRQRRTHRAALAAATTWELAGATGSLLDPSGRRVPLAPGVLDGEFTERAWALVDGLAGAAAHGRAVD
ncbi:short-subunit dehydrogenase [Murinocardiopsis flavida]|uniref:Short-subunit dehydrogenase n=1 Tax=Murinocardiopsis flavida TaxID=645275 RepID=A0A2P8DFC9_9ACTN|nr:SDR family NAD(P)-dependent oxidoreductase [Murinocardiopsis flavida]PSK95923.1 short-subunit dehydrogenase [Murinocardiopsis flavida]